MNRRKLLFGLIAAAFLITGCSTPAGSDTGSNSNNNTTNEAGTDNNTNNNSSDKDDKNNGNTSNEDNSNPGNETTDDNKNDSNSGNTDGDNGAITLDSGKPLPARIGTNVFAGKQYTDDYGNTYTFDENYFTEIQKYEKHTEIIVHEYSFDSTKNILIVKACKSNLSTGKEPISIKEMYEERLTALQNEDDCRAYYEKVQGKTITDEEWKNYVDKSLKDLKLSEGATIDDLLEFSRTLALRDYKDATKVFYDSYIMSDEGITIFTYTDNGISIKEYFENYTIPYFFDYSEGGEFELGGNRLNFTINGKNEYYYITGVTENKLLLEPYSPHYAENSKRKSISYSAYLSSDDNNNWSVTLTIDGTEHVLIYSRKALDMKKM